MIEQELRKVIDSMKQDYAAKARDFEDQIRYKINRIQLTIALLKYVAFISSKSMKFLHLLEA